MALISVVIPTKNRLDLLKTALQSVYNQTYPHVEIIVVDDSSDDGSREYLMKLSAEGRLKYYRNESSQGGAATRNRGIQEASGEFIAFLDDDDEWMPQKLEKQVKLFDNQRVGLVYSGIELIYVEMGFSYYSIPKAHGFIFKEQLIENKIGVTSAMMLRSSLAKKHLFDVELGARQDYELWLRISKDWEVAGVQEPLAKIYARGMLKRITSNINAYEKAISHIDLKYQEDIDRLTDQEKILRRSEQFFFLGSQSIKANNIQLARTYYWKSLQTRFNVKSLASLLASMGGIRGVLNLRRLKK